MNRKKVNIENINYDNLSKIINHDHHNKYDKIW